MQMQEGKIDYYTQQFPTMKEGDSIDKNSDATVTKRKRRSKHEKEGRNFVCELCDKAYLSMPALNNHKNTKHNTQSGVTEKRSRGRPRKYAPVENQPNEEDSRFMYFFNSPQRGKTTENTEVDTSNITEITKSVFEDIYQKYPVACYNQYRHYTEHPVLHMFATGAPLDTKPKNGKNFDDILYEYIDSCKDQANKSYFSFLLKFAVLFRECLNLTKQKECEGEQGVTIDGCLKKEHSSMTNAENAPDLCNDFVTEFLENNNYFGIDADEDRMEIVELIQQFCYWLFANKYTQSRLTRIA